MKTHAEEEVARPKGEAGEEMFIVGSADSSSMLMQKGLIDEYRLRAQSYPVWQLESVVQADAAPDAYEASGGGPLKLRTLHVPGNPLVLPNAWDAASARMVEGAGFPVVATSSFATAGVLGYDDGEATPVEEVLAATARIVRAVSLPVTVTSNSKSSW